MKLFSAVLIAVALLAGCVSTQNSQVSPQDQEVYNKLRAIKVNMDFTNVPLPNVIDYIRNISKLNILFDVKDRDPSRAMVAIKIKEVPLGNALKIILDQQELGYKVEGGVIVITTPDKIKNPAPIIVDEPNISKDKESLAIKNKLESIKLTLNFEGAILDGMLDYIRDATGMNIIVDEKTRTNKRDAFSKPLTFKAVELPLREILKLLLEPLGLTYSVKDGVLFILIK